jgi:ssRNA-specific RNase YbeY (16S rRNA maturation enzyme)
MEAKTFSALQKRFKKIGLITSKELGIKNALHFDVILIDDKEMKEINFKNRKIDKPTDVLSFAF